MVKENIKLLLLKLKIWILNRKATHGDPRIPDLFDRKFTFFYYNSEIKMNGKTIQICWNWGWWPLYSHLYIHQIYTEFDETPGHIITDPDVINPVFDEFCENMYHEYPSLTGVSIPEQTFKLHPDFWRAKGFDHEPVWVEGSGYVHSINF